MNNPGVEPFVHVGQMKPLANTSNEYPKFRGAAVNINTEFIASRWNSGMEFL